MRTKIDKDTGFIAAKYFNEIQCNFFQVSTRRTVDYLAESGIKFSVHRSEGTQKMIDYTTKIPTEQALDFFLNFMDTQRLILEEVITELRSEGVEITPLSAAMETYFSNYIDITRPTYGPWDESVPDWIKSSPEHSKGKEIYSEESKMAIMRMGYFFGEALRESCPNLRWSLGQKRTLDANFPVISGFSDGVDCNTLIICSVVMSRIHDGETDIEDFIRTFEYWKGGC